MMARRVLSVLMIVLGVSAILIGLGVFLAGPTAAMGVTEGLFSSVTGKVVPLSIRFDATGESEMRFYAALWIAYGALLVIAARSLTLRMAWVPPLAAVFFAGGVGRVLAWVDIGPPHPAFAGLMIIELTLPLLFLALWTVARRTR